MNADPTFWPLDPSVTFLTTVRSGHAPRPVQAAQQAWRDRLEADPIDFLVRRFEGHLDAARAEVAAFAGCHPEDLAFVGNATTAINSVVKSLSFRPGDELLANEQEYPAALNALQFVAARDGATVVTVPMPFPVAEPGALVDAILAGVTARTRLALISHVTSGTAIVFPIAEIVRELDRRGVVTLIDGAHAPGMAPPLELDDLGAHYYTGNGHKWLCGTEGLGLSVRPGRPAAGIRALSTSTAANDSSNGPVALPSRIRWQGLAGPDRVPRAGDGHRLRRVTAARWLARGDGRQPELALAGRDLVCSRLGVDPPAPDTLLGSMALVPLQAAGSPPLAFTGARIATCCGSGPVSRYRSVVAEPDRVPGDRRAAKLRCYARISAQRYNHLDQYAMLADAVIEILGSAS